MNRLTWIFVIFLGPICCCLNPVLLSGRTNSAPKPDFRERVFDVIILSPPTMTPTPGRGSKTGATSGDSGRKPPKDRSSNAADLSTPPPNAPTSAATAPTAPPPTAPPTAIPTISTVSAAIPALEPIPASTPVPTSLPPAPPPPPPADDDDDDDGANSPTPTPIPPAATFSLSAYTVSEGEGTASITVVLDKRSTQVVTVNYAAGDGRAVAPDDYTLLNGSLTFNPGETSKTFSVSIVADALDEPDESLVLTLSNPANATLGSPNPATLTIIDDDQPAVHFSRINYNVDESSGMATITVVLDKPSFQTVRVDYAGSDGTAAVGSDYTTVVGALAFSPGETSRSFSVTIRKDQIDEPDENLVLTLSNPANATLGSPNPATLTIIDDDQPTVQFTATDYNVIEGDGLAVITVTLTTPASITATVGYTASDGMATAPTDYLAQTGTLTFAPGETEQTFTVNFIGDSINELDETVLLSLHSPTNAALGAPFTATLTIEDDDDSVINFAQLDYPVVEDNDANVNPVTITVTLSSIAPTTVTVAYSTNEWTASAGQDYVDTSGTLTFLPGQTSLTFTVTISEDAFAEPDETIFLNLRNPGGEAILGTATTATLTLLDDGDPDNCAEAGTATETTPDIGAPDGEFASVACASALVVDLGATPMTTDGGPGFDFVYYEFEESSSEIRLTWMVVKAAQDESGPWYPVFYWGDAMTDANTNIGQAGYGPNSSPPPGIESNPQDIPTTDLFGTPPFKTGVAIDIDAIVPLPSGPYRYIRFEALPDSVNNDAQVDAIENLPPLIPNP